MSTIVRQPVQRQRWAARARCTASSTGVPPASIAATRTMIPGVQNPHCDAPVAANAVGPRSRVGEPVDRGHVAIGDAGDRGHARDAWRAVDEHRAAAALALRAAAILDRARAEAIAQDLEEGGVSVRDLDVTTVEAERDQEKL